MIEFENFSVIDQDVILKSLNLKLTPPFSIGVIGHSGSGKSTFAKAISMLLGSKLKTQGRLLYNNQSLYDLKEKQKQPLRRFDLKYVVQEPFLSLSPYLKIKTQLKEVFNDKPSEQELLDALHTVDLKDPRILNSYPHELSGGQRQRLCLLQALICKPKILIADEPTTALDPIVERQILRLMKSYQLQNQSSLIFVSHDLEAICEMTDLVLVFQNGELVEQIPTAHLYTHCQHPHTQSLISSLLLDQGDV